MALEIITTIGGSDSNSYATLQEFADYCDTHLDGGAFEEAGADTRIRALLQACRELDQKSWRGLPASAAQRLKHPRVELQKPDSPVCRAFYLPTEIAPPVKEAQCLLALIHLLRTSEPIGSVAADRRIKRFSGDGLDVEFENSGLIGEMPAEVMRIIAPLIRGKRKVRA